jgi:hypothetical protein
MRRFKEKSAFRQEGSVMVIVMIILALLTIIGASATNMANNELKISGNDKNYKVAFSHAESGVYGVAKWVGAVVDMGNEIPDSGEGEEYGFDYLDDDGSGVDQLLREVKGYSGAYDADEDLLFNMETSLEPGGDSDVRVDLRRLRSTTLAGSPAASLGEGTSSVGSKTLAGLPYWITSTADTATNTNVVITGRYLKIDGIYSGL